MSREIAACGITRINSPSTFICIITDYDKVGRTGTVSVSRLINDAALRGASPMPRVVQPGSVDSWMTRVTETVCCRRFEAQAEQCESHCCL